MACADRIHNIRSLAADYRQAGEAVWERFRANKEETLWFYREVFRSLIEAGENRSIFSVLEDEIKNFALTVGLVKKRKMKT